MNRISIILIIIFALLLQSCRSPKPVQIGMEDTGLRVPLFPTAKDQIAEELILQSIQQRSNFNWFSANISGNINLDGSSNAFNGQIRIKNGEEIWMTATRFGFELLRLRITTDSVFLHNRFEQTAFIRDFGFFKEMTGVDFTFDMLQDIFVGNYFLPKPIAGEYSMQMVDGEYSFTSNNPLADVMFDFVLDNAHCKFLSLTMRDRQNRSVRINYNNYAIFNGALYPQNLSIRMENPMKFELRLNYQRIQINVPQNMPFSIPESANRI